MISLADNAADSQAQEWGEWLAHTPGDRIGNDYITAYRLLKSTKDVTGDADDWRAAMLQAWKDGELEYRLGVTGEWQCDNATAQQPAFNLPRECYRRRPAPPAVDSNEPMKQRDSLTQAITESTKDEGWREYDPKYPPIQPYPMEFRVAESEAGQRHYYRRADPPIEPPTWPCMRPCVDCSTHWEVGHDGTYVVACDGPYTPESMAAVARYLHRLAASEAAFVEAPRTHRLGGWGAL